MSLFEKYGGFDTIRKVVNELYDALEVNEITAPYFENSDIRALMDHQVKFLSQVLGGPQQYTGKAISVAHTGMKISETAFSPRSPSRTIWIFCSGVKRFLVAFLSSRMGFSFGITDTPFL